MPELPEVETTVRGIREKAAGAVIVDCWTDYRSAFHTGKDNIKDPKYFASFKKIVIGAAIISVERRAKNILIHLSNGCVLLIHMKMTGHVLYGKYAFDKKKKKDPWTPTEEGPLQDPFNRHIHFVLTLGVDGDHLHGSSQHLALSDMRKFAKVTLINTAKLETSLHTAHIGPEPMDTSFTLKKFSERLSLRPNGPIKSALMDQKLIAGIGNIYSDEILWRAGVHPESFFKSIPKKQIALMFDAMKQTLAKGIDFGGDSMSDYRNLDGERGSFQDYHEAYRRTGEHCRRRGCKGTIIRKVVRGRSGHFCDTHQELFK
jgi:formamidopyrimidine-DNA glycosylase